MRSAPPVIPAHAGIAQLHRRISIVIHRFRPLSPQPRFVPVAALSVLACRTTPASWPRCSRWRSPWPVAPAKPRSRPRRAAVRSTRPRCHPTNFHRCPIAPTPPRSPSTTWPATAPPWSWWLTSTAAERYLCCAGRPTPAPPGPTGNSLMTPLAQPRSTRRHPASQQWPSRASAERGWPWAQRATT